MTENALSYRRAIEALRAGVPNRDAVRLLGCSQLAIQEQFSRQLEESRTLAAEGQQVSGLVISGGFGTGKSHLLEHLHHLALEQNFVSSKVVISKETPLYDAAKLYRAAIDAAVVPGKQGSALREIAQTLDPRAPGYVSFYQRATSDTGEFPPCFGASLVVYENNRSRDMEQSDRMISFWSGHKLNITELRKALRDCGVVYPVAKILQRDLPLPRLRFASQLMLAAGYSGWVLLFDEVELVSRYSWLQRARSYAEFARWAGALQGEAAPGVVAVFAATDILGRIKRDEDEQAPRRLSQRVTGEDGGLLVSHAQEGIRKLREGVPLDPPEWTRIGDVGDRLRQVHAEAYGWSPSPAESPERWRGMTTTMRQYVRWLINRWDLERLLPGYSADIEAKDVQPPLEEDPDLERAGEPDEDAE